MSRLILKIGLKNQVYIQTLIPPRRPYYLNKNIQTILAQFRQKCCTVAARNDNCAIAVEQH